jgi:hypothetical protein
MRGVNHAKRNQENVMNRTSWMVAAIVAAGVAAADTPGVPFTAQGELQRPKDYREWVFLTSGLGMTYGPAKAQPGQAPRFDNVFVKPESYREFMKTGKWPEGTLFILEVREAVENASINNGGRTQGGHVALEAAMKDSQRFKDGGWGYFTFDSQQGLVNAAKVLPRTATCYACHSRNGAVEWTFTQFYPAQFEVAKRLGTVRADYDPSRKAE